MTTNPPEGTPEPGSYPPPDSSVPPQTPPAYQAPGYGQTPPPGYGPIPPNGQAPYAAPLSPSDERLWATLAHLGGFLSIIATVIIWAVFKDRGPFVRDQATEALNFQITVVIAGFAIGIITAATAGIGAILYLAFIAALVFMIMGAVAANRGETYRYPINWRLVK